MRTVAKSTISRLGAFRAPLVQFLDFKNETLRLVDLYVTGVVRMRGAHKLAAAHAEVERVLNGTEPDAAALQKEQAFADLAVAECEGEFRLLNAHLLVGVWGVFESAIDEFVVSWIAARPDDVTLPPDIEIKLPPEAVLSPDLRKRAELLFQSLRKRRGLPYGRGVGRFEDALRVVGLDGPVPPGVADAVYEMQQVRNLYAHRGGRVDERFVASLPHLPLAVGDAVPISPVMAYEYYGCLASYATVIVLRGWAKLGILCDKNVDYYWCRGLAAADVVGNLPYELPQDTPLQMHYASQTDAES